MLRGAQHDRFEFLRAFPGFQAMPPSSYSSARLEGSAFQPSGEDQQGHLRRGKAKHFRKSGGRAALESPASGTLARPWLLAGSLVLLAMMLVTSVSPAEILDRVVASIGDVAITQSDVESEYRLERFLDGQWPPPPPDNKTLGQARERLVCQKLLLEEETQDLSHDPTLEKTAAEELDSLRKRFPSEQDYQSALRALHMDEKQILTTLIDQQRILRIIEQRLRPAAAPATTDVESYYHDVFTPEYTRTHDPPVPPLAEVDGQIREILVQKKIDELLAQWLQEMRPSRRVRFYSF
jgi:hypothetical protein